MRRLIAAIFVFAAAACSPAGAPADTPISTGNDTAAATASFPLTATELGGQWSFDRTCGLYDLVFMNDHTVSYYDYADQSHVLSYTGTWAVTGNRVALSVRLLNSSGSPSGDTLTYNLDVTAPVTDDLTGNFGQASGEAHAINAKRCPNAEDRE